MKRVGIYITVATVLFSVSSGFGDAFNDLRYTFSDGTTGAALGGPSSGDLTASNIAVTDPTNLAISNSGNNLFVRGDVTDGDGAVAVPSTLFSTSYPAVDYISWTLTADGGSQLELNQVSFDYWNENSGGSSYSVAFALRSSVDGYASDLVVSDGGVNDYFNGFVPNTDSAIYNAVATLGAAFEGLTSVEFRLFTYGDLGFNSAGERGRLDNIYHSGETTVIPEPATMGLLVGAAGGLMVIRRRFMI